MVAECCSYQNLEGSKLTLAHLGPKSGPGWASLDRMFFLPKGGNGYKQLLPIISYNYIPIVPHKAAAEVSKIGNL